MPKFCKKPIMRVCAVLSLLALSATPAAARDNFLIIIADDLGVDSVAVYSDDVAYGHAGEGANHGLTPRLDTLATEGVLFRHAYTNSTCAPSRAQILTGRHALRTGIGTPGGAVLDLAETTLPELLAATHHNAAIGKWHLAAAADVDHPIDSGFDYFAGALAGNVSDYEDWEKTTNSSGGAASVILNHTVYATDDSSAEAIAKIAEFGEDPWIIYLAFNAPHSPFHVPTAPLFTAVNAGSSSRIKFEAAVEAMDREIGDVLDSIPLSIMNDTTVIFIGDNGTPTGVTRPPFVGAHAKGEIYEGGVNVPLIIKSPHAAVGAESLALVQSTDIFATIAAIVESTVTAEDSISMLPYLSDPTAPTQPLRAYSYAGQFTPNGVGGVYTDHQLGIRDDRFKLIWRNGTFDEFYDLTTHPFEDVSLLPYDGMTDEQQEAFDRLSQQLTSVETFGLLACPLERDPACTTGYLSSSLDWRGEGTDSDKLSLNMKKGPALSQTDYGNPLLIDGTGYSVCLYDDADQLVADTRVARGGQFCSGKECWRDLGGDVPDGKGFKFKDKLMASTGIQKLQFRNGDVEKSKLKVKGRGANLPDGVTQDLSTTTAVTAQVRGSDMAQCLSATLTNITFQSATRIKAK
jgi:arylsulfatase B